MIKQVHAHFFPPMLIVDSVSGYECVSYMPVLCLSKLCAGERMSDCITFEAAIRFNTVITTVY